MASKTKKPAAKRKQVPLPENGDDDQAMEQYNKKVAAIAKEEASDVELARNKSKSNDDVIAEISKTVGIILDNIARGDAPVAVTGASLFVQSPDNLRKAGAVRVKVEFNNDQTADAKLFTTLMDDSDGCGPSDGFISLNSKFKTPEAAMPALIKAAVEAQQVPAADAARLTELYAVWMHGVTWAKCVMSASNRPSLGSWNGWPWELHLVRDRSLQRGVAGSNVEVVFDNNPPEDLVPPEMVPLFVSVLTAEGGRVADHAATTASAVEMTRAFEAAHASKAPTKAKGEPKSKAPAKRKPAKKLVIKK